MDGKSESNVVDGELGLALQAASRAMTARYRPVLDSIGLTYPQYLVMMVLWDEGPCSVGEIGARLRLDTGTTSPMLKRLERQGLITRTRRPADERGVTVAVTSLGAELRARAALVPGRVANGLDEVDHDRLRTTLRRLERVLQQS